LAALNHTKPILLKSTVTKMNIAFIDVHSN